MYIEFTSVCYYLWNLLKFSCPNLELPILSTSKTNLKLSDPFFAWLNKPHEPFDKNNLEIMLQWNDCQEYLLEISTIFTSKPKTVYRYLFIFNDFQFSHSSHFCSKIMDFEMYTVNTTSKIDQNHSRQMFFL